MIRGWTNRFHSSQSTSWKGLAVRLLAALALFAPWDYRFQSVSFRIEDLDPALVEAAQARGWNLLDQALWPSVAGSLGRLGLAALIAGLLWCGIALVRRHVQRRFGSGWAFLALLLCSLALLVFAKMGVYRFLPDFLSYFGNGFPVWGGWIHSNVFTGGGILARNGLLALLILAAEGALLGLEAQQGLREAREVALRSKLAPHFLFNSLNTLHAQIETDPRSAQGTTERLASLFRQVLEVTSAPTVSLGRELAFVEDYLGIEKARLGERLNVKTEVPEELLQCDIPALALQVLVENAVKHGVAPREAGGEIRIAAHKEGRRLTITVEDPGTGISPGTQGSGTALANLRSRLGSPKDLVMAPFPGGHRVSFAWSQR